MIKIYMKDGTIRILKEVNYAEILPERTFVPELVIRESSYSSQTIATFNYGDILGYEVAKDEESNG